MVDIKHVTELLTEMTPRIESFDASSAQRLKLLNNALKNDATSEINAWADVDLYQMIEPNLVLERYHSYLSQPAQSRKLSQWDRPLRMLLLGLPLLLSGLSLAQALTLYPAILSTHARQGSPSFLYWWQQGFAGQLPGWLRASNVLIVDVVLLLAFLVYSLWLSIGPSLRQQRLRQEQVQLEQELHTDLTHMLAMLTLYLAQYKSQLTAADSLTQVARRIDTMARRLEDKFENIIGRFDGMTQNVTQRFDSMTQNVTTRFDDMAQNVTERFDGMSQNVTDNFGGMTQNISSKFDGVTQNITKNLYSTTKGTEKNLDGMMQNVSDRFENMTREVVQGFDGVTKDVATRYDGMSQQVMNRLGQVTDRMLEQLLEGSKYLKEIGKLTSGVVKTADHVRAAATILKETNGELTLQARNLVAPTVDLAQQQELLITAASQSTKLLEEAATTMVELGQKQDRWGTDLRNILDTLDLTIERAAELAFKVGDFTARQDAFLEQLQQDRQAQTQLVSLLSQASEQLQTALNAGSSISSTKKSATENTHLSQ
ncbi:hypothetical protein [Dictyobacter kobayashii]|uniref:Uncharacterized protein n=1 Tax=Dictyobacter kobayashii TaxID=2014872 RepID=A0A402AHK8_9CHLR|nr:hypothetical protein [Dictyobacter kobayashii]GCE18587.1 hypothetical protein KDK_23870 [Dictyobacter kobayashii]